MSAPLPERSRRPGARDAVRGLRRTLRRFAPHLRSQRRLLLLGLLALFLEVAMRLLEPWPLAWVLDSLVAAAGGDVDRAWTGDVGTVLLLASAALVAAVALRALAAYAMTVCFSLAGNRVLTRVRAELYAHLTRLPMTFHDGSRTGDLVTRVTGDVGRLQEATVTAALPLFGNLVTLLGMLVVVAVLNAELALVVLLVFPLSALLGVRLTRRIHGVSRRQRASEGALASLATESLGAMAVVQSYSLEERVQRRFGGSNETSLREGVRARRLAAGLERSTDVLIGLATGVVLYVGARQVVAGDLTPGELTVFLTYLRSAFRPLRDIAKYAGRISRAAASGERIVDVLEVEPELRDAPGARPAPRLRGEVEFDDVHLSYVPGHPVLRGLSLRVPAGRRVAVVGPSGSGKSTLVSLLCRLRDPDSGTVRLDGHPVGELTVASVRAQVAVVLQESTLFATSIRDNIALGVDGPVTDDEVEAAARTAGAHEFVTRLPDGYDTVVGERGSTLSGGQRQRIAIARAAIRRAPIVVLDEAMTGLDPETEGEVAAALARLTAGRTTFVVTHDLAAARDADQVVWLADGRVQRAGHPDEVLPSPREGVAAGAHR
ncbi:ABC transporter ATP-binding protein [Geodermatophilus sp. DSM 44513]|uniref:ABC transporter ATP-binding protein n=1 Tax=Geodermatophilus sp. DSM 44513 TaxID=1528104 RepID=UPI0028F6D8B2|nr:ABC transporter ATP-binding protein [Geodermatophilus sp. DSM 44513]WNV76030.1 ABC transporter ATP-binding protein [Geodermatophilus sp. DSM 44513]